MKYLFKYILFIIFDHQESLLTLQGVKINIRKKLSELCKYYLNLFTSETSMIVSSCLGPE